MSIGLIFQIVVHFLIASALAAFLWLVIRMILAAKSDLEKLVRTIALSTGLLIYLGSKIIGIDIPTLLLGLLGPSKTLWISVLGTAVPSLIGYFSAALLIKGFHSRSEDVRTRLIVLVSTFLVLLLADVYLASIQQSTHQTDFSLILNLSFSIGLGVYMVFNVGAYSGSIFEPGSTRWQ